MRERMPGNSLYIIKTAGRKANKNIAELKTKLIHPCCEQFTKIFQNIIAPIFSHVITFFKMYKKWAHMT